MNLYRAFRGADPDKTPLLKARGLWKDPEEGEGAAEDVAASESNQADGNDTEF